MFRHKKIKTDDVAASAFAAETKMEIKSDEELNKEDLRDLMVKNLKWSQIIYEQNRKINRKLTWAAIASWLRVLIIVVPILLALWFLPPLIKQYYGMYGSLLNIGNSNTVNSSQSLEQILKLLPLDSAQQQQIKAIIK